MTVSGSAAARRLLLLSPSSASASCRHFTLQFLRSLTSGFADDRPAFRPMHASNDRYWGGYTQTLVQSFEFGDGVRHIRTYTKHKVILTTPIERLGKAGQIVNVAPGYARNRLIPNMLALPAIDKFVIMVQNQLQQVGSAQVEEVETVVTKEETEEEKMKAVDVVLRRLAKGRVVIRRDVGQKSTLMKLVTKSDILDEVRRQLGVELQEENLVLESAFSEVGDYDVLLRLPEGLRLPGDKARMFLKIRIRRK